ncbi:Dabb family protein [Dactylosporangium sp. NPDC051541]|uniref:Dabb family protein n=1 Tax=Dactylosporangium sp. NPDC051541 TaxID=3363977 RepID=UPI0037BA415A
MIYHGNRIALRDGLPADVVQRALTLMQTVGTAIPAVRSFVVGIDVGADYDFGAVFVLPDLDGYREYLNHPAHLAVERDGLPLMAKFEAFDITDDDDADFPAKVADLQKRHLEAHPDLAALMAALPTHLGSSATTT